MRRFIVPGLFLATLLPAQTVFACASGLCGDPTITTLGTEKPFPGRLRAGVEYLTRSETVGKPKVDEHTIDEERLTYSISYAPSVTWIFAASIPMVTKEVSRYDLSHEQSSGLGDTDLSARWYVGNEGMITERNLWGVLFGLRVPTSSEEKSGGNAVDFDAQVGSGTTAPSIGVWYGHYRLPWFFYTSAVYRHTIDEGYQGFQAGDVVLLTGHTQYAINKQVAVQFSLDARYGQKDAYYGETNDDSGGLLVMASPGVAWTPVEGLVFNVSYQHPLIENTHGYQEEDQTLRVGVTYDF